LGNVKTLFLTVLIGMKFQIKLEVCAQLLENGFRKDGVRFSLTGIEEELQTLATKQLLSYHTASINGST